MNTAQVLGYPLLLFAALELLLGRLLLTHNPRSSNVNKATAACVFATAIWSLSAALMYIQLSVGRDYVLFARLSWVGWFTVPTAIQSVLYLKDERSRKARITGWVLYPFWALVLGLCLFTDLVVTDNYVPLPFHNSPGPLEMPFRLVGSLTVFWLLAEIVLLRRQVTGFRRSQLSYYLYGTILFGTGGAIVGGFLQLLTGSGLEPSLGAYFGFPWAVMIFYAITRYRLFDIRIVLSRALYILLLSLIVSGFQFLLFKALDPLLGAVGTIFISIPITGIVFFGTPLGATVQRWINELVLRDRLAYQKLLQESANAAVSILFLDELLHFLVDRVRHGLKVERACLYLRDQQGRFSSRECFQSLQDAREAPVLPERIVEQLTSGQRVMVREELEQSQRPGERELLAYLTGSGTELLLPLVSKKRVLGILSLGERADGEAYLSDDLELLRTLADHAAIAVENAMLFEEAGRMRASLLEQEELFRTLAQTLPAAVFIHRGGKFLYFNEAGTRITGYSPAEILDMDFWGVVHPDYRELIMARGQNRLAGGESPAQYEFKILRKDGAERWVLMTAGTIPYEGKTAVIGTIFDITDRKTAEEERERYYRERIAEQERFSAVLSTTGDGFWIVDDRNRIVFVNEAYCRMSGYASDELLARTIMDVEAEESPEAVLQHTDAIRASGHDRFETRHRRKDGSLIDLEVSVNRFGDGKTVFSFLRDITDRKRLEAERTRLYEENVRYYRERIAEQGRLSMVLQATSDGFCIVADDTRLLFVNNALCSMLGYDRRELLNMSIRDIDVFLDAGQVAGALLDIKKEGYGLLETRHRRKDGSVIDVEISINRYQSENQFFAFIRDITGRKRSEEALRRSEERFRQVSETAQEWIWEVDREGRYTYSSPVVTTLLGYRPEEVVGQRRFYDFFVPEEREQLKQEALRIVEQQAPFKDFVNRNLHKDGREVILSTSGIPMLDGEGNVIGYRGVDFDITERIGAERERSRLYEESVSHYQALLDEQHRHQDEKEKILKDLHDGIGGLTTNINLLAELARKDQDPESVKRSLATIAELSRDSLMEIRGFIQSLDERELTWQIIAAEFRHLGTAIVGAHGIHFSIDVSLPEGGAGPSSSMAMNLYRIYKESLANVVKHAKATEVTVRLTVALTKVILEVRDNGVGLTRTDSPSRGRGLLNMQSRTKELGGTLAMTGEQGTQILAEFPIP